LFGRISKENGEIITSSFSLGSSGSSLPLILSFTGHRLSSTHFKRLEDLLAINTFVGRTDKHTEEFGQGEG
jgi:hypothetical protein